MPSPALVLLTKMFGKDDLVQINDLVEQCNLEMLRTYGVSISKRTIQYDLNIMRRAPFNIELDESLLRKGIYRYADVGCRSLFWLPEDNNDGNEKVEESVDVCVLRFKSVVVEQMIQSFLSLGDQVEVVAPSWLRERITEKVASMSEKYMN